MRVIRVCLSACFVFLACTKKVDLPASDMTVKNGISLTAQQVVPPASSSATGTFNISHSKSSNTITYSIAWNNLSSAVIGAHIHGPASSSTTATDIFTIPGVTGTSGSASGTFALDEITSKSADLLSGKWYVDIHTVNKSNGEIRAQIVF